MAVANAQLFAKGLDFVPNPGGAGTLIGTKRRHPNPGLDSEVKIDRIKKG